LSSASPAPGAVARSNDRWLVLMGALMVQIILGVVYGFSALIGPLKDAYPTWSNKDVQLANTLALLFFALTMVPAGRLQDKKGPRLPALLGAGALFLAFMLASTIKDDSQRVMWWLSYGVLYGIGIGLAYVCPIAALVKWFPDIKGLITGVAVAGFGGGAALFIPTVGNYLANHNLHEFFQMHALICGMVVAIGAMLLKNPPPKPAESPTPGSAKPVGDSDLDWKQMLATARFWLLWLMFIGSATAGLMTIAVAKAAVKDTPGIEEAAAATAASVLSLMNALGRVFWGGVSDKIGRERAMMVMFGVQALTMFAIAPGFAMGPSVAILLMGLVGLNFGGNFALFPSATADAFGAKNLGLNYGCVFTAYGMAGVIGPQVAAYFKDVQKTYLPAFMIAGVLVALACVGAVFSYLASQKKPADAAE